METMIEAPVHQLVPVLAGLPFDHHTARLAGQDPAATTAHGNDQPGQRAGQYHIAAAPQHSDRPALGIGKRQGLAQLLLGLHQYQALRRFTDAKGIELAQRRHADNVRHHSAEASNWRTRCRSSSVSTPAGGTSQASATWMRQPNHRARNCSSDSAVSSGLAGQRT